MSERNEFDPSFSASEGGDHPLPPHESEAKREIKAEPHADLIAKYQTFLNAVNPRVETIYHPSSANDCSPTVAFPGSRVVYADIDPASVKALTEAGCEAYQESALEFDPGPVDILIMLNPQIAPDIPASYIQTGGYALVNDYHETASSLRQNPDFRLTGLIRVAGKEGLIYDTQDPEKYWEEVDTEEAFRNAPFDWGAANYLMALPVVEAFTGKRENVLEEYKKILKNAQQEQDEYHQRLMTENPDVAQLLMGMGDTGVLTINHQDHMYVLSTNLPRKKGTVDDLFVFEKVGKPVKETASIEALNQK